MAYSKAFREGLEDAVAKARWRIETHLQAHLLPHPEDSPATRGELSKTLVVLHDCIENFLTEVMNYLEPEVGRGDSRAKASRASARPAAPRGAPRRRGRGRKAVPRAASRK